MDKLKSIITQDFVFFSVNAKVDYQTYGNNALDKIIKENNDLYEKIDRGIRFGNLQTELSKIFEDNIINRIEKEQKNDAENWSKAFTYAELLTAMERKKQKLENPLKIENKDLLVYGNLAFDSINFDEGFLLRNEGSQTAKKRTKNILIFNPEKYTKIHFQVACNAKILNGGISADDSEYTKDGNYFTFVFTRSGLSFHKVEINDAANDITYIFKMCIIDILPEYMYAAVKHSFIVDYKKTKKNSRIKLVGVGMNLIFNSNATEVSSCQLGDNEVYSCRYGERLLIFSSEEEISNFGSGIKIDVNFTGIVVPFILFPDEVKSVEIVGRKILRDKLSNKKSFEFENGAILSDSQEYFAKINLLRELKAEQLIIDNTILCGNSKNFYNTGNVEIVAQNLLISSELKQSYIDMLDAFRRGHTIPTLAYLSGDILEKVDAYICSFENEFVDLEDGENLSQEQENALLLGTITVGNENDEILMTTFHPLNLKYQMMLLKETGLEYASDIVVERLNSINLLPYIQRARKIYKVSDQLFSQEWKYYAPVENKKYRGNRRYVSKLVEEKVTEFISHFKYIFDDINNKKIRINLINMGDCSEVFIGITQFFIHAVNKNADIDKLEKFELHIYSDDSIGNAFSNIKELSSLKRFLSEQKLFVVTGTSMNSLEGILSKNIECYFHKDYGTDYAYSHISFYEMESEITSEQATMNKIETGISLGGILSGIPSSKYGYKYRTGYGMKYAENTKLVDFAAKLNALMQVDTSGNPFYVGTSISTQIDELAENKMEYIYQNSNWVVFVDPKVDLDFFSEKEASSDLLIIHYSDQYTSSSGYDAITVTHKSQQYALVIQEYLKLKGIKSDLDDVHKIINLFNAINGDWLLRLVSSKKGNKDSTFSREKISIVAAIKFMLAFLKHKDIVWIPISLEEMLRVSGGTGLSKNEGVLSAKNLGFDKGPTSDDLLFVGLNYSGEIPKVYLYPTEVKTGNNENYVIKKAFEQVSATANGLHNAFNPSGEIKDTILYRVNRNFLMQMLITSCKKMQVYHVDDSQNWDVVLDQFRETLLNEKYILSEDIQELIGKGAVLSFRKAFVSRKMSFKEDTINFIEMPETDEFGLILKEVAEIFDEVQNQNDDEFIHLNRKMVDSLSGDLSKLHIFKMDETTDEGELNNEDNTTNVVEEINSSNTVGDNTLENGDINEPSQDELKEQEEGMHILFGTNEQDGKPVMWLPNDTMQLFHTNTGIIGTMGTGKTQFTKSLITQLYRERKNNIDNHDLGILIFDYKGDYNESKEDFVEVTNATILKPYHLPFNPLALTQSKVFKPLLPIHTANAFKDTISKIYGLGPKQQDTLFQCMTETYKASGIIASNSSTWNNEAPTFEQVYQRYLNDDIKKTDSLAAVMNKLHKFEVFEANPSNTKSLFGMLNGVVVIDLSGYDADIQNLIVAITLDLFYSQMLATGSSVMTGNYRQISKMILVDEADNFMCEGFLSLKKILKEGREFGVGTILSTQFLKHFGSGEDDYSKYILTWVVHNVSDLKKSDVDFVFKTESKSQESQMLYNSIKNLPKHHSIIKIGNNKPVYVHEKAFWELYKELH